MCGQSILNGLKYLQPLLQLSYQKHYQQKGMKFHSPILVKPSVLHAQHVHLCETLVNLWSAELLNKVDRNCLYNGMLFLHTIVLPNSPRVCCPCNCLRFKQFISNKRSSDLLHLQNNSFTKVLLPGNMYLGSNSLIIAWNVLISVVENGRMS